MRLGCSLWNVANDHPATHARRLVAAGVDLFHWDHTDGVFAGAGGFNVDTARAITAATGVAAEVHLMVCDPLAQLDQWCEFCEVVVVPVEVDTCRQAVRRIEQRGSRPAIAISPTTDLNLAQTWGGIGCLVMSITPGQAGQSFQPQTFERLTALQGHRLLGVDGGVTMEILPQLIAHHVSWAAVGGALLSAPDAAQWLAHARGLAA